MLLNMNLGWANWIFPFLYVLCFKVFLTNKLCLYNLNCLSFKCNKNSDTCFKRSIFQFHSNYLNSLKLNQINCSSQQISALHSLLDLFNDNVFKNNPTSCNAAILGKETLVYPKPWCFYSDAKWSLNNVEAFFFCYASCFVFFFIVCCYYTASLFNQQ